ncbi:MAG: invasion associated locus B family protein [Alphaproteobacteria bacterium]|nr:invasion associated locus B family protein [Alphaproteobacteria bacterium]
MFGAGALRMSHLMRAFLLTILLAPALVCALAATAVAQTPTTKPTAKPAPAAAPGGPKSIGSFDDWQAATYTEGNQTVCYAFVKARQSAPPLQGRGEAVLTVTHRTGLRDSVAFTAGFDYAAGAEAEVAIDAAKIAFYTAKRSAFARDGRAVVMALQKAQKVVITSPHPQKIKVADTFSPKGFGKAYEAIGKACPPK